VVQEQPAFLGEERRRGHTDPTCVPLNTASRLKETLMRAPMPQVRRERDPDIAPFLGNRRTLGEMSGPRYE
jgi:hypothetical protein